MSDDYAGRGEARSDGSSQLHLQLCQHSSVDAGKSWQSGSDLAQVSDASAQSHAGPASQHTKAAVLQCPQSIISSLKFPLPVIAAPRLMPWQLRPRLCSSLSVAFCAFAAACNNSAAETCVANLSIRKAVDVDHISYTTLILPAAGVAKSRSDMFSVLLYATEIHICTM